MSPFLRRRAGVLVALALALAVACQPVDPGLEDEVDAMTAPTEVRGAPQPLPEDLEELHALAASAAAEWQAGARAVEVAVELDGQRWQRAAVTYLAPDADRFLRFEVDGDGTSQQRPTLAALELLPVPGPALDRVPPWPEPLEPAALVDAAAEARAACGLTEVEGVLYATGAPAAWDGTAWTEAPAWTATLAGSEAAVAVDPATGEGGGCLD